VASQDFSGPISASLNQQLSCREQTQNTLPPSDSAGLMTQTAEAEVDTQLLLADMASSIGDGAVLYESHMLSELCNFFNLPLIP
jgi:hypothetical protein